MTGDRIAFRKQRRRQIEIQPVVTFEHIGDFLGEFAVGVKTGDFVFVFVGE